MVEWVWIVSLFSIHRWSVLKSLLASRRQQAEKLPAPAGASVLREPGVQDKPLCQKRQARVGGRGEWKGDGPQREKVQTFPKFPQSACSHRDVVVKTKYRSENRRLIFSHRRMDLPKLLCSHFCLCENIVLAFYFRKQNNGFLLFFFYFQSCKNLFRIEINMFCRKWLSPSLVYNTAVVRSGM